MWLYLVHMNTARAQRILINKFMSNVAKFRQNLFKLKNTHTVGLSTSINKAFLNSGPKPSHLIVEQTVAASLLFIQTPVTSGIWRSVPQQNGDLQRGQPLRGEGAEGTRQSRGKDSLCLYLSIYTHTDTRMQPVITYHVHRERAAMASQRWATTLTPWARTTAKTGTT